MVILGEDIELREPGGLRGALQRLADRFAPRLVQAWEALAEPLAQAVARARDVHTARWIGDFVAGSSALASARP